MKKFLIFVINSFILLEATTPKEEIKKLIKSGKYQEAIVLTQELCLKEKNKRACKEIIKIYKKGYKKFNIDKNISKAFYFATKACEFGVAKGCKLAGDLYWDGNKEANIKQSLLKAAYYYKKACKAGYSASCRIGNDKGLIVAALTLSYIHDPLKEVKELIKAGYDVNAKLDGLTPLCAAVIRNDFQITKFLLQHGANPSLRCTIERKTFTPLDVAKKKRNLLIIELLKNYKEKND